MTELNINVVCCDDTPDRHSRIVEITMDSADVEARTIETIEQEAAANEARELHNAAHHADHGPVTYLQEVKDGGFSVLVGPPDDLQATFFGPGSFVGFMDDEGPGHGSKVGPDGVRRTLRIVKGHLGING